MHKFIMLNGLDWILHFINKIIKRNIVIRQKQNINRKKERKKERERKKEKERERLSRLDSRLQFCSCSHSHSSLSSSARLSYYLISLFLYPLFYSLCVLRREAYSSRLGLIGWLVRSYVCCSTFYQASLPCMRVHSYCNAIQKGRPKWRDRPTCSACPTLT